MHYLFSKTNDILEQVPTVFPHIRPAGTIISFLSKVTVHKCAGIIRGRALYEEIR